MSNRHFSDSLTPNMASAPVGNNSFPASRPTSYGFRSTRPLRHVGFCLDRDLAEAEEAEENARASRTANRRSTQMTIAEHMAWSTRAAELDAIRQRALQCEDDFARVASGLGYKVVTHTPTAFLKRNSGGAAAPVAVAKPDVQPGCYTAAETVSAHSSSTGAAPDSPPSAAVPTAALLSRIRGPPAFLKEENLESCSSRSSSRGSEEEVGTVPVLSPLLHSVDLDQRRLSQEEPLHSYEVVLPRAIDPHGVANRYPAAMGSTHSLTDGASSWSDSNNNAGRRTSPFESARPSFTTTRTDIFANPPFPSTVIHVGRQATPTTAHPATSPSPTPRQAHTPRRTTVPRNMTVPGALLGAHQSGFAFRTGAAEAASSRGTSNANTSLSTEHINGHEMAMVGSSQNTNRFLTPSTDALNTPAVRMIDDEDWPRLYGRPIQ